MQLKIKVNDNLETQGCSRILHPLIHGLTGSRYSEKLHNSQNICDCYLSNQHEKMSLYISVKNLRYN